MPNTYSMNKIIINDMYNISRHLTDSGNIYGLSASNVDSHMMKNSEWGGVVYLAQSKYGRNGEEITINNVSLNNTPTSIYAVTGYAGASVSAGENITTLAALNGGTLEYTASYVNNGNPSLTTYGPSLYTESNARYKNVYTSSGDTSERKLQGNSEPIWRRTLRDIKQPQYQQWLMVRRLFVLPVL